MQRDSKLVLALNTNVDRPMCYYSHRCHRFVFTTNHSSHIMRNVPITTWENVNQLSANVLIDVRCRRSTESERFALYKTWTHGQDCMMVHGSAPPLCGTLLCIRIGGPIHTNTNWNDQLDSKQTNKLTNILLALLFSVFVVYRFNNNNNKDNRTKVRKWPPQASKQNKLWPIYYNIIMSSTRCP